MASPSMTQTQTEAYVCGLVPEHHDTKFVAQHLAAYAFARRFAAGKRVLEVGFGEGYGANYLAEAASEVAAVDVTPGNIPRAQERYARPNLRFLLTDGSRFDFPDGAFDLVCSFQVIEHIPEPLIPTYLREIHRVLTPDGIACLSTLNLDNAMKPGKPYTKLHYHEKEFTGPELEQWLSRFFPAVEMYGLYLSPSHYLFQRFKKWGLMKVGPAHLNPVARFYSDVTVDDFRIRRGITRAALDLIALCRNGAAS
ncbi:MAG: methyltransferase domain-containing protein [Candidatus Omnitrophica bacterium]|nr:methyltransferase domain-containing protein [Candidatus Omnitrophota bacterium]